MRGSEVAGDKARSQTEPGNEGDCAVGARSIPVSMESRLRRVEA